MKGHSLVVDGMPYSEYNIFEFSQEKFGIPFYETEIGRVLKFLPKPRRGGPWICGGSLRRFLRKDSLKEHGDVDYFCKNKIQAYKLRKQFKKLGFKQIIKTGNAYTYTCDIKRNPLLEEVVDDDYILFEYNPLIEIQVVHREFRSSIHKTLNRFPFSICQFGLYEDTFVHSGPAFWDTMQGYIVPNKEAFKNPRGAYAGMEKYKRQGFRISKEDFSRLEEAAINGEGTYSWSS